MWLYTQGAGKWGGGRGGERWTNECARHQYWLSIIVSCRVEDAQRTRGDLLPRQLAHSLPSSQQLHLLCQACLYISSLLLIDLPPLPATLLILAPGLEPCPLSLLCSAIMDRARKSDRGPPNKLLHEADVSVHPLQGPSAAQASLSSFSAPPVPSPHACPPSLLLLPPCLPPSSAAAPQEGDA